MGSGSADGHGDFVTDGAGAFASIGPGALVAIGDGASAPVELYDGLNQRARQVGGVRLLLGWCLTPLDGLDLSAYESVTVLMGGYFASRLLREGEAAYLPVRFGALPSLLTTVLRPDILLAALTDRADGWHLTTDVSWQRIAISEGATVIGVARSGPSGDRGESINANQLVIADVTAARHQPETPAATAPNPIMERIASQVVSLIADGVRLQYAPGALGAAVLRQLDVPVRLDTGVLGDVSRELDERGLLAGVPVAPYCIGDEATMQWVEQRRGLAGVEATHNPGRLAGGRPLVAVNTALQIDPIGQLGIEQVGGRTVAGIGGQPDYMAAAALSRDGISIVAMPTSHAGRSTMVEQLDGAVSTPSHDVDVLVTENGIGWLRGLDRSARRSVLTKLWA